MSLRFTVKDLKHMCYNGRDNGNPCPPARGAITWTTRFPAR